MVPEAGPGVAVEVDGWRDQPIAGDEVLQADDEQHATYVTDVRTEKVEREQLAKDMDAINTSRRLEAERREAEEGAERAAKEGLDELDDPAAEPVKEEKPSGPEVINFIIKGDVSGSVEAVLDSVSSLGNAEISTRILRYGVGSPSEFDISHAASAGGHIINFNTPVSPTISRLAEEKGVKIIDNNIIYRVVENVKAMLEEKLKPEIIQKVTGEADIAAVFEIGLGGKKKMKVAGSKVRNGQVDSGTKVRVVRGAETVYTGKFRHFPLVLFQLPSPFIHLGCWSGVFWFRYTLLLTTIRRNDHVSQEPEERRPDDAQGYGMRYRVQCVGGLYGRR